MILAEDLNTNESIIENQFEIPDLMNKDTTVFPYRYQWFSANGTQEYTELSAYVHTLDTFSEEKQHI